MSVVRLRESPYYGDFFFLRNYDNFFGTLETVRIRGVSVPRGATVVITAELPQGASSNIIRI